MLFCTLQRLGGYTHEDSRGTVVLAATDGCVVEAGRESLATASSGRPSTYSAGIGGRRQDQCWLFLSTLQFHKDPRGSTCQSQCRGSMQEEEDRQAPSQHIPLMLPSRPCPVPWGIMGCRRNIRGLLGETQVQICPLNLSAIHFPPSPTGNLTCTLPTGGILAIWSRQTLLCHHRNSGDVKLSFFSRNALC